MSVRPDPKKVCNLSTLQAFQQDHYPLKGKVDFMNAVRFWAVFSLGVAAGAAAALIYAPQSGDKTRKQLKRSFEDASEYVKDTSDDLGKHATRIYKNTKSVAGDVASKVSSVASNVSSTASSLADKVGDLV